MTKNRRWIIQFDSHEELMQVKNQVEQDIRLDRVFTDIAISFPGGIEKREVEDHKFADYFDDIKMIIGDRVMTIEFYVKENAKNFYKDLMVDVISKVSKTWNKVETC